MKNLIIEFEKTGYTAWLNYELYPDGIIYTKEFTEWLGKKLNDLQPTDSTECDMPHVVGQSYHCGLPAHDGNKCKKQCGACKEVERHLNKQ